MKKTNAVLALIPCFALCACTSPELDAMGSEADDDLAAEEPVGEESFAVCTSNPPADQSGVITLNSVGTGATSWVSPDGNYFPFNNASYFPFDKGGRFVGELTSIPSGSRYLFAEYDSATNGLLSQAQCDKVVVEARLYLWDAANQCYHTASDITKVGTWTGSSCDTTAITPIDNGSVGSRAKIAARVTQRQVGSIVGKRVRLGGNVFP